MKKIFLFALLIIGTEGICQKNKIYATVIDEDNNLIARGIFNSAADSGVIILVDDMEIFVNATEITVLKIEKNPSSSEFLQLGATVTTDALSYLVNKPKKEQDTLSTDSIPSEKPLIATETKTALLKRINALVANLLSGKNDLATMNINNSAEKFHTKLRILQEYSMDKEIVSWNDYAKNQQLANDIQNPQQDSVMHEPALADQTTQTIQTGEPAQTSSASSSNPSLIIPFHSRTYTLNKGFSFIRPKLVAATPVSTVAFKNVTQAAASKNANTVSIVTKPFVPKTITGNTPISTNKNSRGTIIVKPAITSTNSNQISTNKQGVIMPSVNTPPREQTKLTPVQSSKITVPVKNKL